MNVKNVLVGGIAGGLTDFFLGWIIWKFILHDATSPNNGKENLMFIALGCLCFGLILSYVCNLGEGISNWMSGMKTGAVIALLMHLWYSFFESMYLDAIDYQMMGMGAVVSIISGGIVGGVVATVIGKMK